MTSAYHLSLENDQGIVGTSISGIYQPTPIPASLTLTADPGTYLLHWYAEVMRTTSAGGSTLFARLRDVGAKTTYGLLRDGPGLDNGPPGAIPGDDDLFLAGDVLPFAGSIPIAIAGGEQTFRLEYGLSLSATASEAVRARRQRIALLRME